jgi:DedD protein
MAQLRNGTITLIVLSALLVIIIPLFFLKSVPSEFKPLTMPTKPPVPSADQFNPGLNTSRPLPLSPARAWTLEVADFKENSEANALVQTLREKDFKAYARHVTTSTGPKIRVFVGPEIQSEKIKSLATRLQAMQLNATKVAFDPLLL